MRPYIKWTAAEWDTVAAQARVIRASNPKISWMGLMKASQMPLPPSRRRTHFHCLRILGPLFARLGLAEDGTPKSAPVVSVASTGDASSLDLAALAKAGAEFSKHLAALATIVAKPALNTNSASEQELAQLKQTVATSVASSNKAMQAAESAITALDAVAQSIKKSEIMSTKMVEHINSLTSKFADRSEEQDKKILSLTTQVEAKVTPVVHVEADVTELAKRMDGLEVNLLKTMEFLERTMARVDLLDTVSARAQGPVVDIQSTALQAPSTTLPDSTRKTDPATLTNGKHSTSLAANSTTSAPNGAKHDTSRPRKLRFLVIGPRENELNRIEQRLGNVDVDIVIGENSSSYTFPQSFDYCVVSGHPDHHRIYKRASSMFGDKVCRITNGALGNYADVIKLLVIRHHVASKASAAR